MPGPWGPSSLNLLGFVAYQAGLPRGDSGCREKEITKTLQERLLEVLDKLDPGTLKQEDKDILARMDKSRPWLLTTREMALLERLKPKTN